MNIPKLFVWMMFHFGEKAILLITFQNADSSEFPGPLFYFLGKGYFLTYFDCSH